VVSKRVGNGATATECEKVFLALPLEAAAEKVKERSITPDVSSSERIEEEEEEKTMLVGNELLKNIIESAHPEVVKAATDAALAATNDVSQAQKAGLLALVASEAAGRAKKEEETVSRLLAELQEQRLQKLENRMALLDDVEGILEAERVALELERRDLYTARCRHWFGGAS
jgi:SWI/SNF related-matrix-associated actin-dependent regulator of chromatin subfamily C